MAETAVRTSLPRNESGEQLVAQHIIRRAGIFGGRPYVQGTRLTVEFIQEQLAGGVTGDKLMAIHPQLTQEGLEAARRYVVRVVNKGILRPTNYGR